jgi:hypothetical protein
MLEEGDQENRTRKAECRTVFPHRIYNRALYLIFYCGGSYVLRIMYRYYYYMCLANYGASEAVNLCSMYVEKSTKYSEQKALVILENKISCSLTVVCASSFRSSHYLLFILTVMYVFFLFSLSYCALY